MSPHPRRPPKAPSRPRLRPQHTTVTLDALGLLRCRRVVMRGIAEETEVLGALVSLIETVTSGIFADTPAVEIRAAATMVKAATVQLGETSLNLAAYLGAMKLIADLDGFIIEEPEEEPPVGAKEPFSKPKKGRA